MSELATITPDGQGSNGVVTSLELVKEINMFREQEGNRAEMIHKNLLTIIRDEFEEEINGLKILPVEYRDSKGELRPMFELTPSQAKQVLVRESKFVRRGVIAKLEKLEANAKTYQLPTTYLEALKQLTAETEVKMQLQLENQEIKQERDKVLVINELQEKELQLQAPKVEYHDKVIASKTLMRATQIAADFGMSANGFNKWLDSLHVQRKVNDTWVLTAQYQGKGYAELKPFPYIDTQGQQKTANSLCWTEKGREFLHNLLDNKKTG